MIIALKIEMWEDGLMKQAKRDCATVLEALRVASQSERAAVEYLEGQRWGDTPACARCGSVDVYQMRARDGQRNKDHRWRCRDCKRMHSVRTGTVFEESRLPLHVWIHILWRASASI